MRDGVPHPPQHPAEFELLPGVPEALRGWPTRVSPWSSSPISRTWLAGTQTRAGVEVLNDRVRAALPVLDVLTCFHDTADGCACRKPRPGLLLEAARRWRLDPAQSFMVGDRWSDIEAGRAAGCRTLLVTRPYSQPEHCSPDCRVADLTEGAAWILGCKKVSETFSGRQPASRRLSPGKGS